MCSIGSASYDVVVFIGNDLDHSFRLVFCQSFAVRTVIPLIALTFFIKCLALVFIDSDSGSLRIGEYG